MTCTLKHLSIGCNRAVHCADWSPTGIYAFAGGNFVALWRPERPHPNVYAALPGHTGRVMSVRWVRPHGLVLVSGGPGGRIIVWYFEEGADLPSSNEVITAHTQPVIYVDGLQLPSKSEAPQTIIVSIAAAPEVKIWLRKGSESFNVTQTLTFPSKQLMHCAAFSTLPQLNASPSPPVMLALGGVDQAVQLYICLDLDAEQPSFHAAFSLRGHLDWVRCLRFSWCTDVSEPAEGCLPPSTVQLASAAQDARVRLWRVECLPSSQLQDEEASELTTSSSPSVRKLRCGENHWLFAIGNQAESVWRVTLDAMLVGHEDWVMDVNWHPVSVIHGVRQQPASLLSCSLDRTMVIWAPDAQTSIWNNIVSVGEFGGLTGLFSQLGFYGCTWSPSGNGILSHGYVGEFHYWVQDGSTWEARPVPTGHAAPVVDLAWHSAGICFTVGTDQTTRVIVPKKDGSDYFELARAQIHGHDMTSIAVLSSSSGVMFASGAEEKVVRIFDAPSLFFTSLEQLTDIGLSVSSESAPLAAACPALGLSNKPIMDSAGLDAAALNVDRVQIGENEMYEQALPVLSTMQSLPLEEQLLQSTLWPERIKLYGHPNEIVCLAASERHLASACKAQSAPMAEIIIWDIRTFKLLYSLPGHALTVTQLAFNHDGTRLLSVSRDRHFILWDATKEPYTMLHCGAAHGRIIWTCSWSHDGQFFATGSRDEMLKVWHSESPTSPQGTAKLPGACTALAFAHQSWIAGNYLIAVGLGTGSIWLYKCCPQQEITSPIFQVPQSLSHDGFIHRLMFCPLKDAPNKLQLASCSDDHSVRILVIDGLQDVV